MRSLFSFCLLWISEGKRTPRKLRRRILWRLPILTLSMDGLVTVQMWCGGRKPRNLRLEQKPSNYYPSTRPESLAKPVMYSAGHAP
ncbi:hypothetical protein BDV40DRAFT_257151 [Aspergillus tamarii]|uniref:Uncharacterized protein n=1 Tax=Aspergillus tamarii TaxID=41984 RepID=A0A5N6V4I7_ASPTM|nr:hypothetical protein BDV40DRAFT_257151 [Aspergillus tamarii]